jgi:hypothetical protein
LAHKIPDKAIQLLLSQSSDMGRLGQPKKWAVKRLVLARDLIWDKKIPNSLQGCKKSSPETGKRLCGVRVVGGFYRVAKIKKTTAGFKTL